MMPATRTRTERLRETAKRQIVGVLMDATNTTASGGGESKDAGLVDGTNELHVSMVIEDLQKDLDRQLDSIKTDMMTCKQDQLQAHYSGMMKIPKSTREMTVQEFNQKHNCNLLDLLKSVRLDGSTAATSTTSFSASANHVARTIQAPLCGKRDRLETPAPYRGNRPIQTPSTVRTVKRGEMIFSRNGSPVDAIDEGALIATVTKKRRGNAEVATAANFDINIGEGRYLSLNDPSGVQHLDEDMKTSALSQLKVLQDQMAFLMEKLSTTESSRKKC